MAEYVDFDAGPAALTAELGHIHRSLAVRGIHLRPWPRETTHQMFRWGPVHHGLLTINDRAIVIIGLMADRTGTGQFGHLMSAFETAAHECGVALFVVHFRNDRLHRWFGRRGYLTGHNRKLGHYAAWATDSAVIP